MGQALLKDLGFQIEDSSEKKKMIDEYIKTRMNAKYPEVIFSPEEEEERPPSVHREMESIREEPRETLTPDQPQHHEHEEEEVVPPPKKKVAIKNMESEDEEELPHPKKAVPVKIVEKEKKIESEDEEELPPPKKAVPVKIVEKEKKIEREDEEELPLPKKAVSVKIVEKEKKIESEDEEELPPPKRAVPVKIVEKEKKIESEDEEEVAPPKKVAPMKKIEKEEEEEVALPKKVAGVQKIEKIKEPVERDYFDEDDKDQKSARDNSHNRVPSQTSLSARENIPKKKELAESGIIEKPVNGQPVTSTPSQKAKFDRTDQKSISKKSQFGKDNIFNGIEKVDFKSPATIAQPSATSTRSRRFMGFENKYFRPTRGRSPSPMTEDPDIYVFDDEDDQHYHEDEAQFKFS